MNKLLKFTVLGFIYIFLSKQLLGQCLNSKQVYDRTMNIINNKTLSDAAKLQLLHTLKAIAEKCGVTKDSACVLLLLKTGSYESYVNNNHNYAITLTNTALLINKQSIKKLRRLTINGYFNLATFYQNLAINNKALNYYDTVLVLTNNLNDSNNYALDARWFKTRLYFLQGDYQQAVEESTLGMNMSLKDRDSSSYLFFLNQKAQSLCFENYLEKSLSDARTAIVLAKNLKDNNELATAYKTTAFAYEKNKTLDSAEFYFTKAIKTRLLTGDAANIASDYNDFGNFYLNSLHDYGQAEKCYRQTLYYAAKIPDAVERSLKFALTNMNRGVNFFSQQNFSAATAAYIKCFGNLNIRLHNIKENAAAAKLSSVANKDLVIPLLQNKVDVLLALFKQTNNNEYLKACITTAIVADSVITQIRHEEIGEESKLHWRKKTRGFFTIALEACYIAKDYKNAFYFMERSRAVLLTDQLNEIGAAASLPLSETEKQRNYENKLTWLEQKLLMLSDTSRQYQKIQVDYFSAKADFERYITSLEVAYPVYYQYKYADKVPALNDLKTYLLKGNQNFVHYYIDDSVTYILAITATNIKFIRLPQKAFNKKNLEQFLQFCSDKQKLNNNYNDFIRLSNSIYTALFQPLQLPKGKVIICADNIAISFEALCADEQGKNFLLSDYSFSYVYSVSFLMKQFNNSKANGNFIGFAPVLFEKYLNLSPLTNAAKALSSCAAYYKNKKLFTNENATRNNFFNYASSYSIVNIFSHATADTTGKEPEFFMEDSVIHLSELQRLNNPATQLVLLSACQTNVGKTATGEGIYSLARGFATAGIPSVAATLWKADEGAVYAISEKFNQYLSEGMRKDEALQKARLYFIENNQGNEKLLPYYWANIILIGDAGKINLSNEADNFWWWLVGCICLLAVISSTILVVKKKRSAI